MVAVAHYVGMEGDETYRACASERQPSPELLGIKIATA